MENVIQFLAAISAVAYFYKTCEALLKMISDKNKWRPFVIKTFLLALSIYIYLYPLFFNIVLLSLLFLLYNLFNLYNATNKLYQSQKQQTN